MSNNENISKHPLRSLFERMESYEKELDLSSYEDHSANIWPLLKFSIYQSYTLRYLNKNTLFSRIKKKLAKEKSKTHISHSSASKAKIDAENCKEIWISYASNRKMFKDQYNKFIDPYFHYLSQESSLMYELGSSTASTAYPHPIFKDQNICNLDSELQSIRNKLSLTQPQKAALLSFYRVKNKFKLGKLKKTFPELNIYSAVYEYEVFKHNWRLYDEFFSRFNKLEKVFLSSYYFADRLGMMTAASKYGIECIDIQHGVQSSGHYAYSGWETLLMDEFKSMPKGFLVYTKQEKERLDKELSNSDKVQIVGNLSYTYWKENRKLKVDKFEHKYLLYSLQNRIPEGSHYIWDALHQLSNDKIHILFRLHPAYKDLEIELKKMLLDKNIAHYAIDKNEDIYDSLDNCLFHITQFSSSTLDALLLGKTTVLIDPRGKEYFSELINKDDKVVYSENEVDFTNCIQHIIGE